MGWKSMLRSQAWYLTIVKSNLMKGKGNFDSPLKVEQEIFVNNLYTRQISEGQVKHSSRAVNSLHAVKDTHEKKGEKRAIE